MPVLLLAYAPVDSLPLPLEFFAGLFLWALPVVPAGGCLAGLLSLHGFFHGKFSRKKRRKISALLGLSFSGAVVFTDSASWPQVVRLLDDCRAGLRSATASGPNTARILPQKFPAIFPARYFMRAVKCLLLGILTPPYSPPTAGKNSLEILEAPPAEKIPAFAVFAKNRPKILAKNNSPVPPKGGRGERFSGD